jgi:hypothetical protein
MYNAALNIVSDRHLPIRPRMIISEATIGSTGWTM